jgi:hypothetical protein
MTFRPASHPSVTPAAVPTVTLMVGPTMSVRSYVKYFSKPAPGPPLPPLPSPPTLAHAWQWVGPLPPTL